MNCKSGDIALVLPHKHTIKFEIVDKIVKVVKLYDKTTKFGPMWLVEGVVMSKHGRVQYIADMCLRPIRGGEGTDEMIKIAGLPHKEIENA